MGILFEVEEARRVSKRLSELLPAKLFANRLFDELATPPLTGERIHLADQLFGQHNMSSH